MDILIKGPGEVTICLVDQHGKTMLRETLRVFGSDRVQTRRPVELKLATRTGHVRVSPVLVRYAEKQTVTFEGKTPALFTHERCKAIGAAEAVAKAIVDRKFMHLPRKAPTRSTLASFPRT